MKSSRVIILPGVCILLVVVVALTEGKGNDYGQECDETDNKCDPFKGLLCRMGKCTCTGKAAYTRGRGCTMKKGSVAGGSNRRFGPRKGARGLNKWHRDGED